MTQHENAWRQSVFENYLEALKDAQSLVTLELDPSFYLMLGETVGVQYGGLVYALQIVSVTYNAEFTRIQGRTV